MSGPQAQEFSSRRIILICNIKTREEKPWKTALIFYVELLQVPYLKCLKLTLNIIH